jgi:hypothetical protein
MSANGTVYDRSRWREPPREIITRRDAFWNGAVLPGKGRAYCNFKTPGALRWEGPSNISRGSSARPS